MVKTYEHIILYYFSGTGNAKFAAEKFRNEAEKKNTKTSIINIAKTKIINLPESGKTLIGFFSPTHGFNFPPIVLNFMLSFPKRKNTDVFILNTRAGMKMHKLFLPGLSGVAQYFAAIIFKIKGFNIVGMQPLDMPSNWISVHPGLKDKIIISIVKRCEKKIEKFANKLFLGKKVYTAFWSLPFDVAIAPISILYYFVGRFGLAKTFYATHSCTNCGLCLKKCPVNAIKEIDNRMFWSYNCESCMKCMTNCPQKAIQTSHSYSAALWISIFSLISPFIYKLFFNNNFLNFNESSFLYLTLEYITEIFIFLTIVLLAYRVFHFFMRFKFFSKIMEYTSLTRYWRTYNLKKTLKNYSSTIV